MKIRQCKMCAQKFEVTREWKIFCSQKCRMRWNKDNAEHCFYCGAYAVDRHRHHVEPCYWRGYREFRGVEWVYTCPKCNHAMADIRFDEVLDAVEFLLAHYRQQYKPRPAWNDEEIAELGHSLRKRIKKMLAKERVIEDRVIYLEASRVFLMAEIANRP